MCQELLSHGRGLLLRNVPGNTCGAKKGNIGVRRKSEKLNGTRCVQGGVHGFPL